MFFPFPDTEIQCFDKRGDKCTGNHKKVLWERAFLREKKIIPHIFILFFFLTLLNKPIFFRVVLHQNFYFNHFDQNNHDKNKKKVQF